MSVVLNNIYLLKSIHNYIVRIYKNTYYGGKPQSDKSGLEKLKNIYFK